MKKFILPIILSVLIILFFSENSAQKQKSDLNGIDRQKTQQELNDSLENELHKAREDTNKVNILNNLAHNIRYDAPDKCIALAGQALELSENLNWKKGQAIALRIIGIGYLTKGVYEKTLSYSELSLKIAEEINDKLLIAEALESKGLFYQLISNFPKALEYHEKALKIAEDIGDKSSIGRHLGNIGLVYRNLFNYPKALEYFEQALKIAEESGDKSSIGNYFGGIGSVYQNLSNFPKALEYYEKALKIAEENGIESIIGFWLGNIGTVYQNLSNYQKALEYYEKALKIAEETGNKRRTGLWFGNIGKVYQNLSNYPKALEYHEKALKISEEIGDKRRIGIFLGYIGSVYQNLSNYPKAFEYFEKAFKMAEETGDKIGQFLNKENIGGLHLIIARDSLKPANDSSKKENLRLALKYTQTALNGYIEIKAENEQMNCENLLSDIYEAMGDYKSSLSSFKNAQLLKDSIFSLDNQKKIANIEAKKDLEIQQKENERLKADSTLKVTDLILKQKQLALLNNQQTLQKLEIDKKNLLLNSKNNELNILEKDKKLQELSLREKNIENEKNAKQLKIKEFEVIQARNERLALFGGLASLLLIILFVIRERSRSEKLLLNILPKKIAARLKRKEKLIADRFDEASVIFIDQVSFTEKSLNSTPEEIVNRLNDIYIEFDKLADKYGLEKIKTIGDCFMAACGIPEAKENHADATAKFALEAMELSNGDVSFRAGIDCGPVVAGVIGKKKFIYDLWGDTVNTASRMEEYGEPDKIQVTERFRNVILNVVKNPESALVLDSSVNSLPQNDKSTFQFIDRGEIEIKGKGMMRTWFLENNNF